MSLTRRVADLIEELGGANVDRLVPHLEGYTRKQVLCAMQNAAEQGLAHCNGRAAKVGGIGRGGSIAATYYPGPSVKFIEQMKAKGRALREIHARPPASVWELGHGRQIAGTWPPKTERASRYAPLGDWPEYQPREAA